MFVIAFATIVAAVSAGVIQNGACPDSIKPVENFNVSSYQGVWYEISKFPTQAEQNGNCGQAEYKLEGNEVRVKNTNVVKGVQTSIEGVARFAPDANNAAKLLVSFKFGDQTRDSPLSVVLTDYNRYAVAYSCKYDEKTKSHETNVWVLSRAKTLEGEAKTAVDNFLKANAKEIDASKLVQTDFSEEACKFTSTNVITEDPYANGAAKKS